MGVLSRLRFSLSALDIAQIQREWKVAIHRRRWNLHFARRMDVAEKTRETAALGFVAVHGKRVIAAPAGMRDVIRAAAERTLIPGVVKIEPQRRVGADGRFQTHSRLPGPIPPPPPPPP